MRATRWDMARLSLTSKAPGRSTAPITAGLLKTLAEVCYPDLVCQHCGAIMPAAGHECSEGR